MAPPNLIAMTAAVFPPAGRGKAVGWLLSATGVSAAVGVPLVAYLLGLGTWRLPFAVIGMATLAVWLLFWVWCPHSQRQPGRNLTFFAHYREVAAHVMFWYILAVNALQQIVFFGMFTYLATYQMQTYQMPAEATALPLVLAGGGVIAGSFLGGRIADHRRRLAWFTLSCWGSRLLALGGFPQVGFFCLGMSMIATVVLQYKVRESVAFLARIAQQKGTTATE